MRTISRPDVLVRDFLSRNRPRVAVAAGSGGRRHFDTRRGLCLVGGGVRYSSEEERRCDKHGESCHD